MQFSFHYITISPTFNIIITIIKNRLSRYHSKNTTGFNINAVADSKFKKYIIQLQQLDEILLMIGIIIKLLINKGNSIQCNKHIYFSTSTLILKLHCAVRLTSPKASEVTQQHIRKAHTNTATHTQNNTHISETHIAIGA